MSSAGIAIVTATLVLTRSRAAWLAFAAVVLVTLAAILRASLLRITWRRRLFLVLFTGGGIAAALLLPNTLRWRDDNPYLATVQRVADYEGGSGRGRLIQYRQSLQMALRDPLFGAGPGNWAVEYPGHAARNDPSMNDSEPGMTFNPWPSSDWVAYVSERGFLAAGLLAAVFLLLALDGWRQKDLAGVALLGTVAGAGVTGLFDAMLLLPIPAFLVWTALGGLSGPVALPEPEVETPAPTIAPLMVVAVLLISLLGVLRSGAQLAAMQLYETGSSSREPPPSTPATTVSACGWREWRSAINAVSTRVPRMSCTRMRKPPRRSPGDASRSVLPRPAHEDAGGPAHADVGGPVGQSDRPPGPPTSSWAGPPASSRAALGRTGVWTRCHRGVGTLPSRSGFTDSRKWARSIPE
ncbi:MAG TPA: O-antigen ligase family protein [Thermoanaerobaculia bacterium]|nr:O-antigen ligase family protein [Thermoanaerobaculia bacterium]